MKTFKYCSSVIYCFVMFSYNIHLDYWEDVIDVYNINHFSWNIHHNLVNLIFSNIDQWSAILLSYK